MTKLPHDCNRIWTVYTRRPVLEIIEKYNSLARKYLYRCIFILLFNEIKVSMFSLSKRFNKTNCYSVATKEL